jgi:Holliday junction resolvase RusA-like endonuclease
MKLTSPLFVTLPRKTKEDRKMILNLNNYRNWHYLVNNKIKEIYTDEMSSQLKDLKLKTPIILKLKLFPASNRVHDRSNVVCIQEKFFCDALVHYGCIEDDNNKYITSTSFHSGEVDKDNPRVEIDIEESN